MPVRLATRSWDGNDNGELVASAAAAGPLALLVHGVTSSSRTWWRLAPELVRRGYRVLALDLRGHGASPPVDDELVLGDLTADVVETLGALGLGRPGAAPGPVEPRRSAGGDQGPAIDLLIGHSLGALVALDLLATVPGAARRLVLEDPPGPTGIDWPAVSEGIRADGRRARSEPEAMRRELVAGNPAWVPEEVDRRLADLVACDSDGIAAALSRTTAFDLIGLASAVRVPTLLVIGLERLGSALVGPDRAALVAALDGHADVEVLDTGHNLHREAFTRYLGVLDRWLAATAAAVGG
ncbi:MAG TPA: alpha/beta fold hydrolase [Actinomycetes bacterium]